MGGWASKRRRWLIIGAVVVVFALWLASGVYVVRLVAGEEVRTRKIILAR